MSKQSYIRGFCKQAAAHGVDPIALARYASELHVEKPAEETPKYSKIWDNVRSFLDKANDWHTNLSPNEKAMLHTGAGLLGGGAIGGLVGGKKGALGGALAGGAAGAAINWKAIAEALNKSKQYNVKPDSVKTDSELDKTLKAVINPLDSDRLKYTPGK